MFRIITGLWVSQAVGTVAELGIADELAKGPLSAAEVAARVGADQSATFRLLRACASVGILVHEENDRFSLTPLGTMLRSDVPGSMRGMAIAQTAPGHWLPWGKLRDAVRTGQRQTPATLGSEIFEYYGKNAKEAGAFMGAMDTLSALVAMELVRVVDLGGAQAAVDVGGAHGVLIAALLRANPSLQGILLDLPHVVAGARDSMAKGGLGGRCEVVTGDFFAAVPSGGDIYLLKQILHDWDDEQSLTILRNCAKAMKPGGRVLIVEMVIPDDRRPTPAQLMDLNMLVLLPGRERTAAEYRELLARAGLTTVRILDTHSPFQIVEASR
jgi:hypothetical protein